MQSRQASSKICNRKNCIHYVDVNGIIDTPPSRENGAFPAGLESAFHSEFAVFRTCATDLRWSPCSLVGRWTGDLAASRSPFEVGRDGSGGKFLLGGDQTDGKLLCPSGNRGRKLLSCHPHTARYRPFTTCGGNPFWPLLRSLDEISRCTLKPQQ